MNIWLVHIEINYEHSFLAHNNRAIRHKLSTYFIPWHLFSINQRKFFRIRSNSFFFKYITLLQQPESEERRAIFFVDEFLFITFLLSRKQNIWWFLAAAAWWRNDADVNGDIWMRWRSIKKCKLNEAICLVLIFC